MRTLAALALVAMIVSPVLAGFGAPSEPPVFAPVPDPGPSVRPVESRAVGVIVDDRSSLRPVPSRPVVRTPPAPVRVELRGTLRPGDQSGAGGVRPALSIAGTASWYCGNGSPCTRGYPGGLYAAAGPALRVGDWRGRVVRVCRLSTCIRVTLIDACQCYGARVLDLYSDAFRRLAPLSAGLVKVTVSW